MTAQTIANLRHTLDRLVSQVDGKACTATAGTAQALRALEIEAHAAYRANPCDELLVIERDAYRYRSLAHSFATVRSAPIVLRKDDLNKPDLPSWTYDADNCPLEQLAFGE